MNLKQKDQDKKIKISIKNNLIENFETIKTINKEKTRHLKVFFSKNICKKIQNPSKNKSILNIINNFQNTNYIIFLFFIISIFVLSMNFVYSIEISLENVGDVNYYQLSENNRLNQENLENFKNLVCQSYQRYIELNEAFSYLKDVCKNTELSQISTYQENVYYLRSTYFISNSLYLEFLKNLEKNHYDKLNQICQDNSIKITNKEEKCADISNIILELTRKETIEISHEDLLLIYSNFIDFDYKDIKKIDILSRLNSEINENKYTKSNIDYKKSQLLNLKLYNIYDNSFFPYNSMELSYLDLKQYKKMEDFILIKDKTDIYEVLQKTNIINSNIDYNVDSNVKNNENNYLITKDFDFSFLKLNNYYYNPSIQPSIKNLGGFEYSNLIEEYNIYIENLYQNKKNELFSKIDYIYKIRLESNNTISNDISNHVSNLDLNFRFNQEKEIQSYYIYITNFENHLKKQHFENVEKSKVITIKDDFFYDDEYYIIISNQDLFVNETLVSFNTKRENIAENNFISSNIILLEKLFLNSFELYEDENQKLHEFKEDILLSEKIKLAFNIFILLITVFVL
ncbi:MAG: hypothetical protein PHT94_05200, partial [Candidatus Nanoarchaeia archaeon]|nr:hypothetical protein [Candidatus Nanoarchaeia archaeon]